MWSPGTCIGYQALSSRSVQVLICVYLALGVLQLKDPGGQPHSLQLVADEKHHTAGRLLRRQAVYLEKETPASCGQSSARLLFHRFTTNATSVAAAGAAYPTAHACLRVRCMIAARECSIASAPCQCRGGQPGREAERRALPAGLSAQVPHASPAASWCLLVPCRHRPPY